MSQAPAAVPNELLFVQAQQAQALEKFLRRVDPATSLHTLKELFRAWIGSEETDSCPCNERSDIYFVFENLSELFQNLQAE